MGMTKIFHGLYFEKRESEAALKFSFSGVRAFFRDQI